MATLLDYCSLIRSKNAGPFVLTFDLMCKGQEHYDALKHSGGITRELIAALYACSPDVVTLVHQDSALAVKISIPRPVVQGSRQDTDSYAGQQYVPLLHVDLPALDRWLEQSGTGEGR